MADKKKGRGYGYSGRRVLYVLAKKVNCGIHDFTFCGSKKGYGTKDSRSKAGIGAAYKILYRFRDNGLIGITKYSSGDLYYLTEKGEELAKPIVNLVDDYKKW